ncbi:MAG: YeiH family protein [Ruminococcus sp.]|nr:YeiH family protein [Ruminococcus sp.]
MKKYVKGILLCLAIALGATLAVNSFSALEIIGAPVISIILGMILTLFIKNKEPFAKGITFTSKKVLQYAVILLGFGLNLAMVGKVGLTSLPIIISTISTSLIMAFIMYKLIKIPSKTATLIGVGSSICGGSAIAATAPVIDADDEEIAQSISVIFLFNVIAALIFPTLGGWLGMSDVGFGLFAGTAVNDTSSVTAAASTWDTLHNTNGSVLEYATIVKLTRTLAIIPITLVLAFIRTRKEKMLNENNNSTTKVSIKKIFPMFILYFVLASVITTIVQALLTGQALENAQAVFGFLKQLSKFFIVMAMAAIGLNTNIVKLVKSGGKPIILGLVCWVSIAFVSIVMQNLIGVI